MKMTDHKDILISIIVPVYNVEQYLDDCVKSILCQTHKKLEIILVDDGSPDKCPAMCDAWAIRDNRIKVLHLKNGGAGAARNAGLKVATGEYFGFVDSDDTVSPQMLEIMLKNMLSHQVNIASIVFDETRFGKDKECLIFDRTEAINEMLDVRIPLSTWSKLYRTDKFKDIKYATCTNEDFLFNIDCLLRTDKVLVINKSLYNYRTNNAGVTHTVNQRYFDQINIFAEVKQRLQGLNECSDSLMRYEWRMMLHIAHVLRKTGNTKKFADEYKMCHNFVRRNLWRMLVHPKMRWTTKVKALMNAI